MNKFVWDSSATLNIKEPNADGYSPGHSLMKDLMDGCLGEYQNIFPALAMFEVSASVSRMHREGHGLLREFYIVNDRAVVYDVDWNLVMKSSDIFVKEGFDRLRGADLVFACIAYLEDAVLVTLDAEFAKQVGGVIRVLDLNDRRETAAYVGVFESGS